jgi:hypothetical protein
MKRFTIQSVRTYNEYVTYSVEAETKEEALELVESGEIEDNDDHWQREMSGGEDFEIINEVEI